MHHSHLLGHKIQYNQMHFTPLSLILTWSASSVSHHQSQSSKATKTRTRMPAFWGYPPLPHDYPYYWSILDPKWKQDKVKVTNLKKLPKIKILLFWKKKKKKTKTYYMRHTNLSCLIRCVNMKWIWQVLLKIQSGHDSVHRRTDGWTDGQGVTSIPLFNFPEVGI